MEYPVRNPLTTFLSEDVPQLGHHYCCSIKDMTFSLKQANEAIRKSFEMKIPGGSLASRTKGHCLVLPLLKQNNIVLRTMSMDLKIIVIRVS